MTPRTLPSARAHSKLRASGSAAFKTIRSQAILSFSREAPATEPASSMISSSRR
jgi:hypothetical protein